MDSEGKIGIFEAISLATLITINKVFFTSIGAMVFQSGTAAWFTTLISCSVTLFSFMFVYLLLKRFPGKDMTNIYESVAGKFLGKILLLGISGYLLYNSGSTLREFVEMIKVYNLPYTPTSVILITFLIAAVVIAYFGFQTLSRICSLCFIPVVAGLALILLLAIPEYNFNLIKPIGGHGIRSILTHGTMRSSAYFETMLLAYVVNSINGYKTYKRIGVTSILLAGATFSISVFCYIMVYGYTSGSENISGIFELSRSLYFSRFIQRIESIFLFIWVVSSVITTTASYYIGMLIYCKVFKIKDHRPLLIPFAVVVFIIALLPASMQEVTQINITILREYSNLVIYLPPVILLLLSLLRGKKGGEKDA